MRPMTGPHNRLPRGGNHCDFCGAMFVARLYACKNFEWAGRSVFKPEHRVGRWAACEDCAVLIDQGMGVPLVARVMRAIGKRAGLNTNELQRIREDLRLLYCCVKHHLLPKETLAVYQPHYIRRTG